MNSSTVEGQNNNSEFFDKIKACITQYIYSQNAPVSELECIDACKEIPEVYGPQVLSVLRCPGHFSLLDDGRWWVNKIIADPQNKKKKNSPIIKNVERKIKKCIRNTSGIKFDYFYNTFISQKSKRIRTSSFYPFNKIKGTESLSDLYRSYGKVKIDKFLSIILYFQKEFDNLIYYTSESIRKKDTNVKISLLDRVLFDKNELELIKVRLSALEANRRRSLLL